MYKRCLAKEREDKLYALWVAYYTNPFAGKDRKTWDEFYKTSTQKNPPKSTGSNITGVDLARLR